MHNTIQPPRQGNPRGLVRSYIEQQRTTLHPATGQQQTIRHRAIEQQQTIRHPALKPAHPGPEQPATALTPGKKRRWSRFIAIAAAVVLALTLYFIWHSSTPITASSTTVQQNPGSIVATTPGSATAASSSNDGSIQVYVTGAVKHPGVYTLDANARLYQLLQAAGGPLPNANLVALNLAARLTDGEEVYVLAIGETPPTYVGGVSEPYGSSGSSATGTVTPGQLVNINTASVDDLRQGLHVSSTTAQKIVDYRTQYGPYTSVDQLTQVVSRSIYDRIKNMVTVS